MRAEIERALKIMGISPPVSIKELKRAYRKRLMEGAEVAELSSAYRLLLEFMESYPFRFSEEEIKRACPSERFSSRFGDLLWGGR